MRNSTENRSISDIKKKLFIIACHNSGCEYSVRTLTDQGCIYESDPIKRIDALIAQNPDANYLLLYNNAATALAYALKAGENRDEFLNRWIETNRKLIQFSREFRSSVILENAQMLIENEKALCKVVELLGYDISNLPVSPSSFKINQPELLVAQYLIRNNLAVKKLNEELEASSIPLGNFDQQELIDDQQLFLEFYDLQKTIEANEFKIKELNDLVESANSEIGLLKKQLKEQNALIKDIPAKEKKAQETGQENELLLLQLHQVQEKLEHYYLKYSEVSKQKKQTRPTSCPEKQSDKGFKQPGLFSSYFSGKKREKTEMKQAEILRTSGDFDSEWYLTVYQDVAEAGVDPILHYLRFGADEGRNPSPNFSTCDYLSTYVDVADQGMNPLYHYVLFGREEGRDPLGNDLVL